MYKIVRTVSIIFLIVILMMFVRLVVPRAIRNFSDNGPTAEYHMQIIYSEPTTYFFSEFSRGARAAEAELDIFVELIEADKTEIEGVVFGIRIGIRTGIDGVAFSLNDNRSIRNMISTADSNDAQLILYQGDNDGSLPIPLIGADAFQIGYKAGRLAIEASGDECRIAVVINSMSLFEASSEGSAQLEGILSALEGSRDVVISGIYPLDPHVLRGQIMAHTLLDDPDSFDIIICLDELTTSILAQRIQDLGLTDIQIIGYGAMPRTLDFISQGIVYAALFPDAYAIGYNTVSTMYAVLSGEPARDSAIELFVIDKTNVSHWAAAVAEGLARNYTGER